MIQHINSLGEELRRIRKWKNLKQKEVLKNLETRYGVAGSLYSTVNSLSRIERGKRSDLEKENALQLFIGGYGLLDESEINRLLALIGYGPIDNQERARHQFTPPQSSTLDFARSTKQDTHDPSTPDNSKQANRTFVLSVDAIILNSVGELIFGFVSDRDIAECHSSYERSLEDFAFSLVYGAELRAKWERRDPRLAPKDKPAEPAEFLIWSLSGAPYRVERFRPEFHADRIFENQSDRDTILSYIRYMGICMRRRRFAEWCRDWLRRESVIYLGDDKSLFNAAKEPRDLVFGKKYDIDETLLREIPKTLGENELATLVGFVPRAPSEGTDRADGDRYTEQARARFVLENVLTQITTMYQFEKHVASTKAWRVPYGLRAELTKEFSKGHQQRRLRHILLSHALDYALREISLSSDRVDLIHTLCEMRKHRPFREIRAMLDELSVTLWREDDDGADRKAERFIEEIRRAGSVERHGSMDTFLAAHSSVLRELSQTDPDGYRHRLYALFPELNPQHRCGPDAIRSGIKSVRAFLPQTLAG